MTLPDEFVTVFNTMLTHAKKKNQKSFNFLAKLNSIILMKGISFMDKKQAGFLECLLVGGWENLELPQMQKILWKL